MKCPFCGCLDSRVLDTRSTDEGEVIRRRRECPQCDRRFTTYERMELTPLMVVKKDGRREVFSTSKVLNGMIRACEKRPIPLNVLEEAAAAVERELRHAGWSEVSSQEVGERVMDKLRAIDEVAYVRFASVYRQFKDVGKFREELEALLARKDG